MLRTVLVLAAALALTACSSAPQPDRLAEPLGPLPTAEIIAPANPLPGERPALQAAPEPRLAVAAAELLDTPVLEATATPLPTPEPSPTAEDVEVALQQPAPTADAPRAVTRVVIDAIGLDRAPLPVGVDEAGVPFVPKHDVGWFRASAVPGEGENIVLWGHALRFLDAPDIPAPFGQLSQLAPGDAIVLYDASGTPHTYHVARQVWATPDQVHYILPVGREQVTLVSCIGDRVMTERGVTMTHRLITIAE
nr:MAG: sortase [Chloroflexota bacterium]